MVHASGDEPNASYECPRDDETWVVSGAHSKLRRKVQNRLNQRASRKRKAHVKKQIQQRLSTTKSKLSVRPLRPKIARSPGFEPEQIDQAPEEATENVSIPVIGADATRYYCSYEDDIAVDWPATVLAPLSISALQGLSPSLDDYHARKNFFLAYSLRWPKYGVATFQGKEPLGLRLFRSCISDPLLLDTVIAGIAIYRLIGQNHSEDVKTLWKAQIRVSRSVRWYLAAGVLTDAVINAVRLLGLRSPIGLSQSTPQIGRFKSLGIEQLGGLDLEGQLEYAEEHYNVFTVLLKAYGIEKIRLVGVGEKINRTDLIRASIKLGHPSPFRLVLEDLNARRRPLTSMLLFRVNKHFKEILLDLRLCCKLLDEMYDRISAGCPRKDGMLAYYRDIVQYRLLSLPCGCTEMEIARLASLVFTYGVTHPMVRPEPLRKAVRLLSQSLRMQRYTYGQSAEFLFWAAMVGALGTNPEAEEEALFQYFVDEISASRKRLNLSTWQSAVAVLKGFIWLDRACNEGARIIWTKFCGTKGDNEE